MTTSNFVLKKSVVDEGLLFSSLDGSAVGGRRLAVFFEERKKKRQEEGGGEEAKTRWSTAL